MSGIRHPAVQAYEDRRARDYAYFNAVPFENAHPHLSRFVPSGSFAALDVGAGSGRDALALVKLGATVDAVEPWTEMRCLSEAATQSIPAIRWVDDELPDLLTITARGARYDLIILSAVLMHLDQIERKRSLEVLRNLVTERGFIYLSIRHPPDVSRHMFSVDPNDLVSMAHRTGLDCVLREDNCADALGREGVTWSFFCFKNLQSDTFHYSSE